MITTELSTINTHTWNKYQNGRQNYIPAKPNEAVEDDTELQWHVLVVNPSHYRPELYVNSLEIIH